MIEGVLALAVVLLLGLLVVFTLARIMPGVVAQPLVRLMHSRIDRSTVVQVRWEVETQQPQHVLWEHCGAIDPPLTAVAPPAVL
jgi:ABC-type dipeptide/oligopeptide/nickel transport system permease component